LIIIHVVKGLKRYIQLNVITHKSIRMGGLEVYLRLSLQNRFIYIELLFQYCFPVIFFKCFAIMKCNLCQNVLADDYRYEMMFHKYTNSS